MQFSLICQTVKIVLEMLDIFASKKVIKQHRKKKKKDTVLRKTFIILSQLASLFMTV